MSRRANPPDAIDADAVPGASEEEVAVDGPSGSRADGADGDVPPVDLEGRLRELTRVLMQVARGDFSERPRLTDEEDTLGELEILLRFLVDDLERARAARDREVERLREVDRLKSQFINMAAHELSTPLTPIRMQLHLLGKDLAAKDRMDDRTSKSMDILDRNMERVMLLVEDLLETSRIESGTLSINKDRMDLYHIVSRGVESFAAMARARRIRLQCRGDVGLWVYADPQRIGQVVDNLVKNALKFTPPGGQVEVRVLRRRDEGLVEVVDSGVGLDADEIAQLFKPFTKLTERSPHGDPGTGLGLYISKGLVERHGGLLWCESPGKGQGSTFQFALPLAQEGSDLQDPAHPHHASEPDDASQPRD